MYGVFVKNQTKILSANEAIVLYLETFLVLILIFLIHIIKIKFFQIHQYGRHQTLSQYAIEKKTHKLDTISQIKWQTQHRGRIICFVNAVQIFAFLQTDQSKQNGIDEYK